MWAGEFINYVGAFQRRCRGRAVTHGEMFRFLCRVVYVEVEFFVIFALRVASDDVFENPTLFPAFEKRAKICIILDNDCEKQ